MSMETNIQRAEATLERKLDWIGRYDSRTAFVAGISIAMLGVLANACAKICNWNFLFYSIFGLAAFLLIGSLVAIYIGQFPKTKSKNDSLLFFGTIGKQKLDTYQKSFKNLSEEDYLDDLLCQIHINAEILVVKFKYLKFSLVLMLLSAIPWSLAIYLSKLYIS